MRIFFLLAFFLLTGFSGCQTKPDNPPNTVTVEIPVTVPCVTDIPVAPKFITDEELGRMNDGAFVTSLHVDRLQRIVYEAILLGVLAACH